MQRALIWLNLQGREAQKAQKQAKNAFLVFYRVETVRVGWGKYGTRAIITPLQTHPCNENRVFPV